MDMFDDSGPPPDRPVTARERLRRLLEQAPGFYLAPTGHGQAAIWFMQQLSPMGVAYNGMFAARIPTEVVEPALRQAVRALVERHPALRTVFVEAGGRPYQKVLDEPVHEFLHVDASALDEDATRLALAEHAHRPLDLDEGPILRVVLMSRRPRENYLLLVIHHIAADATSTEVVVRDLQGLYGQALRRTLAYQEPAAPYTRFVRWEREWLAGPEAEAALRWWSTLLEQPPSHVDLPRSPGAGVPEESGTAPVRSAEQTYVGDDHVFRWDAAECRRLRAFASQQDVSLYAVLITGFFATLHQVTHAEDLVLATAVDQRNDADMETAVGYYINTVLLRARPTGRGSFRDLLREVNDVSLGVLEHRNYPLDLLATRLNPPREQGRAPWFDFAFNWLSGEAFKYTNALFHGVGEPDQLSSPLPLVPLRIRRRIAKFDLELTMGEVGDEVLGQVQYKTNLLEKETVTALMDHFHHVLFAAVEQPDRALACLLLGEDVEIPTRRSRASSLAEAAGREV